ncbi:MAG: hypothetical protein AMK73_01035 [Planctomycetes bacterium SM23_32]|nr:MAG: hypothetical protein AMK73_01035 [Planctomycetes bacterium SM23_32]
MARLCEVTVDTADVVQRRFGGVGFHVSHHLHATTQEHFDEVLAKRWRELAPSFARLGYRLSDGEEGLATLGDHLVRLRDTGTEVYLVTWDPEDVEPGPPMQDYARRIADQLHYLVRERGAANVRYYCMTNELTLHRWADMVDDMPRFRAYHRALFDAMRERGLPVGLLASDASPIENWQTIGWAAEQMDDVTAVYGGHHYFNEHDPADPAFYPWFLEKLRRGAGLARARGKDFILGEFGCRQDLGTRDGRRMDVCTHFGTPREPLVGMQLAEAVLAALNGGVRALANWTFTDYPDSYRPDYVNRWGAFRWEGDHATRAHYYAYGLLTRFFRGPATAFAVHTAEPLVRGAAVRHHDAPSGSVALVNRCAEDVPISLAISGERLDARFRKYVYDPADVPQHPFGDLQQPSGVVPMSDGRLADVLGAGTLAVYTTACSEDRPAPVEGLEVKEGGEGRRLLQWQACPSADLCYYRAYRGPTLDFVPGVATQIGSTTATRLLDRGWRSAGPCCYKVLAVNRSGNAGAPAVAT